MMHNDIFHDSLLKGLLLILNAKHENTCCGDSALINGSCILNLFHLSAVFQQTRFLIKPPPVAGINVCCVKFSYLCMLRSTQRMMHRIWIFRFSMRPRIFRAYLQSVPGVLPSLDEYKIYLSFATILTIAVIFFEISFLYNLKFFIYTHN